jgi:YVTN family beta-propeller protein
MPHRAFLRAIVALVIALAPGSVIGAPFAYITRTSGIDVIDVATDTVTTSIFIAGIPIGVAFLPSGAKAYVPSDRVVHVIDATTHTAGGVVAGPFIQPSGIAANRAGTRVYVADLDTVEVIDTSTDTVVAIVAVGSQPAGVVVDPADAKVYVANQADDTVSVIDTATNTVVDTIPVGDGPYGIAIDPGGSRVYVANTNGGDISVIDTASAAVIATIDVGSQPTGIAMHPAGDRLYVADYNDSIAWVIDTATYTRIADLPASLLVPGAYSVAVDPTGSRVYLVDTALNEVDVFDAATNGVVKVIPVGDSPQTLGMFISPWIPGAPSAPVAAAADAQATVNFTPPTLDGGSPITGYTVISNPPGGVDANAGGAATTHTITGLVNGTAYTFTVTATNAVGTGPASVPSNSVTPMTVPGAPTAVTATAGNAQAMVSFTPPVSDGGSPITGYTVTSIPAGGVDANAGSTATTHTITSLVNGTAYTFTVSATNAVGTGPASAPSNSVTPTTVPGAPTAVTASAGNAQATVTFTPPASNGGSPITGYTVTSIPAGGVDADAGSTATTHTIMGLANSTAYTFTVTATNAVGTGPASAPSNSVTPTLNAFTGPTGAGNATVSFTGGGAGCTFAPQGTGANQSAFFIPVSGHAKSPPAGSAPANVRFPYGLLDFVLIACTPGSTVTFTVTYPAPLPAGTSYYKYGPTPTDATPHWYTIPASVGGNTATFSIVDGGLGDDDLAADGTIVDQGGPGIPVAASVPVPTLSEWALAAMAALFAVTGGALVARRRRA